MNLTLSILTIIAVLFMVSLTYKFFYKSKQIKKTKPVTETVKNNLETPSQIEVDVKSKKIKQNNSLTQNTKVVEVYNSTDTSKKQEDELNNILPVVMLTTLASNHENTFTEIKEENTFDFDVESSIEIPVQIAAETPIEIIIDYSTATNLNNEPTIQDNTVDFTTYRPSPSSALFYESPSYSNDSSRYSSKSDYNSSFSSSSSDSYSSSDSSSSSSDY